MKHLFIFAISLFTVAANAAFEPNLIECEGPHGTEVTYSTSSKDGSPRFRVVIEGKEVKLPVRPQITTQKTAIGAIATVTDNRLALVDGPLRRYSLVVPEVQTLARTEVSFDTVLILTSVSRPLGRPAPFNPFGQRNQFFDVSCTAKSVDF